jgi:hypothetical protein
MPLWLRNTVMAGVFLVWMALVAPSVYEYVAHNFNPKYQPNYIAFLIPGGTYALLNGSGLILNWREGSVGFGAHKKEGENGNP